MKWSMVLPILLSLVIGHLFARPVKADEDFRTLLKTDAPAVTVATKTTVASTMAETTVFTDGHTITITPSLAGYEEFFGVPIRREEINCVGSYAQSQNAILDKARAYNAAVAHNNAILQAAQARANAQQNKGRGLQQRINIRYR